MVKGKYYSTFSGNPFFNMAMDDWMFQRAFEDSGSVFLRLYSWNAGAITFGFNQDENKVVDEERLNGTPLIRRVTGGRALYHDTKELTYSVSGNLAGETVSAFKGSLPQSSRAIALALLKFLEALNVKAHYVRQSSSYIMSKESFHTLPCFESKARHEIVGEKGKIIASAQRRMGDTFLQHGSIKIKGIAHHPALGSGSTNSLDFSEIHCYDERDFYKLSGLFCDLMGKSLGIAFDRETLSEQDREEISILEEFIKKNCTSRRGLIKQIAPGISLSYRSHN